MCNLNILIKSENTFNKDIITFLQSVTAHSYTLNNDGEGIYFNKSDKLIKSTAKLNLYNYEKDIYKSSFIIAHERISTSGNNYRYHQPFQNQDFVIIHNGIMSDFSKDKKSDTYGFFRKFLYLFKKNKNKKREKKITKSIQKLLNGQFGSYSIALYDKKTQNIYYFKDESTRINFYKFGSSLYITTNDDNFELISLFHKNNHIKEMMIKPFMIYKIEKKKTKIKVYGIADIKPYVYAGYTNDNQMNVTREPLYNNYRGDYEDRNYWEEDKNEKDFQKTLKEANKSSVDNVLQEKLRQERTEFEIEQDRRKAKELAKHQRTYRNEIADI